MLSSVEFVRQSLEIHLFFLRIMKEHSFFLEAGFTPRDTRLSEQADDFRKEFDKLLTEVVFLSNGIVSPDVLQSGEVVTPYTLDAEMASAFYTGVKIPFELTQREAGLNGGTAASVNYSVNPLLDQRVASVNQRAIALTTALIQFKDMILSNVLACKMFTSGYPLLIEHIMREARLYVSMVTRLQNRETTDMVKEAFEQEFFWNRIMAEHSKFIRGLLDPTEDQLIDTANNFSHTFDQLTLDGTYQ